MSCSFGTSPSKNVNSASLSIVLPPTTSGDLLSFVLAFDTRGGSHCEFIIHLLMSPSLSDIK